MERLEDIWIEGWAVIIHVNSIMMMFVAICSHVIYYFSLV